MNKDVLAATADIIRTAIKAHVLSVDQIPRAISEVFTALISLDAAPQQVDDAKVKPIEDPEPAPEAEDVVPKAEALAKPVHAAVQNPVPKVDPRESVFKNRIICLECGNEFTTLKRHIETAYGMTPDQYRQKWGLDERYPMTAPSYSATRSKLARNFGLGTRENRGLQARGS